MHNLHAHTRLTRSLGYLVNRNRPEQLQEVVADLCTKLTVGSKEQVRDVASLGLKTVVAGALDGVEAEGAVPRGCCQVCCWGFLASGGLGRT